MTRSRRAGLSRDQARQQPLYARMLGLQYLAPSGFLCFVFLEGAVALGFLLALAELVSWWGVLVLPVTVAVMVKLNDVVAGVLIRPAVRERARAMSDASRWSEVRAGAGPLSGAEAAGVPSAPSSGSGGRAHFGDSDGFRDLGGRPGVSRVPGVETVRLSASATAQVGGPIWADGSPPLRPAVARDVPAEPIRPLDHGGGRWAPPPIDASALNGPPAARHWTEPLDDSRRRARQSAARRYE